MKSKKQITLLALVCLASLAACEGDGTSNKVSSTSKVPSISQASSSISSSNSSISTSSSSSAYISSSSSTATSSSSSHSSSSQPIIETYTITWINYNGDVLEVDSLVPYGTIPSYDGKLPTREKEDNQSFIFSGWTPEVTAASEDKTYTATFTSVATNPGDDVIVGVNPIISEDLKTVKYGFYPQTHVKDENVINALNALESPMINNWYNYEGEYYTKVSASTANNENYVFNDGTSIVNGTEYWFKCEPIEWKIIGSKDGALSLMSTLLLDTHNYYNNYDERKINDKTVYANNYENSDIRKWLNETFYETAFAVSNNCITSTLVNNRAETSDVSNNEYASENTNDNVYLLSYKDYLNSSLGFESVNGISSSRECKTTDYTRARGAWCNPNNYNGSYWTRSASSEFSYCAWNVNTGGYLSTYAVDGNDHCVRPCISILI